MYKVTVPTISTIHIAEKGFFYVGGKYIKIDNEEYMVNQMFIEVYVPHKITKKYPIIFFHGAGQTNLNWLSTINFKEGFADFFLKEGYVVYLAEQPSRGRSSYNPRVNGERMNKSTQALYERFISNSSVFESSKFHTQINQRDMIKGNLYYDNFMASQVEYLSSNKESQQLVFDAAKDLLDKTGKAILITHSQAGPFGWNIADAYPEKVHCIIALEPSGPPFGESEELPDNSYGISQIPLNFQPTITAENLEKEWHENSTKGKKSGWILKNENLRLPSFDNIPILILCGQASYHSEYDYLTSHFLNQLKVAHDFIPLESVGIYGNGHMMMIENNSEEIAKFIENWINKKTYIGGSNN